MTGLSEAGSLAMGREAEEGMVAPPQLRSPSLCLPHPGSRQASADLGGQKENPGVP